MASNGKKGSGNAAPTQNEQKKTTEQAEKKNDAVQSETVQQPIPYISVRIDKLFSDDSKKLKAIADDRYPGLIKDIYIGKGNYNQDLYPRAILLEFGTHEMEKALVIDSTKYMAEVVNTALGSGNTQSAPNETKEEKKASVSGIGILIGAAVIGIVLFALAATGSFRGAGQRIRKTAGELTGGLFKGNRKN